MKTLAAVSIVILMFGLANFAQANPDDQGGTTIATTIPAGPQSFADLVGTVEKILGYVFGILLIVSMGVMLWAAFMYVTSKGSAEQTKTATTMIVYAAIGLLVALLSKALATVVPTLLR